MEALKTPENAQKWMTAIQNEQDPQRKKMLQGAYDHIFSGLSVGKPDQVALQKFLEENPDATAQEIQAFQQASRPPRSASAMSLQKFMQEHPDATSADIQAFVARQAGQSSEERAVGQRAGGIAIAVDEARKTVPNVLAAAEKSAGRGLATWNSIENKWNVEKGDPDFAFYVQQINSLINVYGRVISGGGKGTVSDLEHARQMLNPNMPLSAVKGALRGFSTEIDIAEKAPGDVRSQMRGGPSSGEGSTGTPPPAGGAGGNVIRYDAQGNRVQQ
jgi:hypothetical protein